MPDFDVCVIGSGAGRGSAVCGASADNDTMSDWDAVKQRADIVDVIGQYVSLQRAGNQFKARCPFHDEKTPSFSVRPDWQTFHCFGCGAKGDVFKFIERKENLAPVEALRLLAKRYGVQLAQRQQRDEPATARMYEATQGGMPESRLDQRD